ncbi:hypothetical protein [Shimia sp.]|uniref:hypothetical protein n=1 Tax=Shimia sp. TaxID=1954381 RepID=UPI003BAB57CE
MSDVVLIVGSGPNALVAAEWGRHHFDHIVAINNAWRIRDDWSHLIYPEDFPLERRPAVVTSEQSVVVHTDYVPQNNAFGGVLFAGGTMAFTAGYWAVGALRPRVLAFIGCDMVYPTDGRTHFYGTGAADPLRDDVSLQCLEAKSARLALLAAQSGCLCVNLSGDASRLVFPKHAVENLTNVAGPDPSTSEAIEELRNAEAALGYDAPSGRYWEIIDRIDREALAKIDAQWLSIWNSN